MTALAFGISWLRSGSDSLTLVRLFNKYAAIHWRSWSQCEHGMILSFFGSEKTRRSILDDTGRMHQATWSLDADIK